MSAVTTGTVLPDCPYPGLDPFSYAYRGVFFARVPEVEQVTQKLVLHRTVLLYADSGVGKSSLLNAGVLPRAQAHLFQPERIRVSPIPGQEFVVERIATGEGGYLPSLFGFAASATHEVVSADAFLARVRSRAQAIRGAGDAARPLLIFDQFEEWTTLVQNAALNGKGEAAHTAQQRIAEVLLSLVCDRSLPVKVMLSLREDYLGSLTPLIDEFPDFTDSYVRLDALDGERTLAAVCGPFTEGAYSPAMPTALAETIRDEFVKKSSGGSIRSTEVQIVCERLFLDVAAGAGWEEAYQQRKGVQGILEGHLERRLGLLPSADRGQATVLLGCLLTGDGTRNVVSEQTLLASVSSEGDWPHEALRSTLRGLEQDARLIVQSARRGVTFYEIASEFLVPWIRARTEERRSARERDEAELDRLRSRRQRRIQIGTVLVVLALLLAVGWVWDHDRQASQAMRRAQAVTVLDAVTQHAMRNTIADPQLGLLLALHAVSLGRRTMGSPTLASMDALRQAMAATPRMRLQLVGHRGGVKAVDVSPGGEYIATASEDSSVRIWDSETGLLLQVFEGLPGAVKDVAFSADGRSIAMASQDTVHVWDAFGSKKLTGLPVPSATRLAYSPDGRLLAAGDDNGRVRVWALADNQQLDTLPPLCESIASLAFSPSSTRLAVGCAGFDATLAVILDFADPSMSRILEGSERNHEVPGVAFSVGSDTLVTAGSCCPRVIMWDVASGNPLTVIAGHVNTATAVAFLPTGKLFATVGRDRTIQIIDAATGLKLRAISGHDFWVEDVAFFPDGNRIVTGSGDSTAVVWDVTAPGGPQLQALSGHNEGVEAVGASEDGRLLVSLDHSGQALWWDAITGDSLRAGDSLSSWQRATRGTRLAMVGNRLVMNTSGDLSFWSVASRRVEDSLVGSSVVAFAVASDSLVAGLTADSLMFVRNMRTNKSFSFPAHLSVVTAIALSPDGRHVLAVPLPPDTAALFDGRSGKVVAKRAFPFRIRAAAFSPDGKLVALGGDDQAIELLEVKADSLPLLRRLPHGDIVTDLTFNRSGQLLASASRDGNARVWNPDSGKIVAIFDGHQDGATSVAFVPGDQRLVVGAEDGIVRIHALNSDSLLSLAVDMAVRPLSSSECGTMSNLRCPTATDRVAEGRRLALRGMVAEAAAAFDSAAGLGLPLPFEPEHAARSLAVRALVTRAGFDLEAVRMDSARAGFARATALDSSVDIRTMVIEAAERQAAAGHTEEAGTILRMGTGPRWYRPGTQRDVNLLIGLGSTFLTAGRLDDAELAYGLGAVAVDSLGDYDRATAYNNLAYVLSLKNEHLDSAATLVARAIEVGGSTAAFLDTQAWVEYQAGRCSAAVQPVDSALAAAPRDAEIASHFMAIHCSCGERKKARTVLRGWKSPVPKELTDTFAAYCPR